MAFEDDLKEIFDKSIDAQKDTLWYSKYETLYDAILCAYYKHHGVV